MLDTDKFNINEYSLNEFSKIPPFPGIYSWHAQITNVNTSDKLEHYNKFYSAQSFKSTVEGFFSFQYDGYIDQANNKIDLSDRNFDENLSKFVTKHLAPPIYIGIARKSLKTRLNDHIKQYGKLTGVDFNSEKAETKIYENGVLDDKFVDTETESAYFAERLTFLMRKAKIEQESIFVRTYSYNHRDELKEEEKKLLKDLEYLLNRTYRPILGRK